MAFVKRPTQVRVGFQVLEPYECLRSSSELLVALLLNFPVPVTT